MIAKKKEKIMRMEIPQGYPHPYYPPCIPDSTLKFLREHPEITSVEQVLAYQEKHGKLGDTLSPYRDKLNLISLGNTTGCDCGWKKILPIAVFSWVAGAVAGAAWGRKTARAKFFDWTSK